MSSVGDIWPEDWADDKYGVWLRVLGNPAATGDDLYDAAERFRNSAWCADPGSYPPWFDDAAALDALTHLASEDVEDDSAMQSAGETLAAVWMKKGAVDRDRFKKLADAPRAEVLAYLKLNRPDLLQGLT